MINFFRKMLQLKNNNELVGVNLLPEASVTDSGADVKINHQWEFDEKGFISLLRKKNITIMEIKYDEIKWAENTNFSSWICYDDVEGSTVHKDIYNCSGIMDALMQSHQFISSLPKELTDKELISTVSRSSQEEFVNFIRNKNISKFVIYYCSSGGSLEIIIQAKEQNNIKRQKKIRSSDNLLSSLFILAKDYIESITV